MKHRIMVVAIATVFLTACGTLSKTEGHVKVLEDVVPMVENTEPEIEVSEPDAEVSKPVVEVNEPVAVRIIGQVEYVDIMPEGIRQKGRIDTGAETTSIDALEIEHFERDGKSWVKFKVRHRVSGVVTEFAKPVERTAFIKRHGADNVERPVVKMTLAIGSIEQVLEVSLTDRSKFEFPVLIGRNFLDGKIAVDVSNKFLMLDK